MPVYLNSPLATDVTAPYRKYPDLHHLSASAHADGNEILSWLRSAPKPPRRVFITHGEPEAADALRVRIDHELHWDAHVPDYREVVDLRKP